MIIGQDRQVQAILSSFPFVPDTVVPIGTATFNPAWLPQFALYVRQHTTLPVRMQRISTTNAGITLSFCDAAGARIFAQLTDLEQGIRTSTAVLQDTNGLYCGILRYSRELLLVLRTVLQILYDGQFVIPPPGFTVDPLVLVPYGVRGVQKICDQSGAQIKTIRLGHNIVIPDSDNIRVDVYCDIPLEDAICIQGSAQDESYYVNKHIQLYHSVYSDIRVATTNTGIVVAGARNI